MELDSDNSIYRYEPYGAVIPANGNFTDPHNHYTLTGKEFDENTGLVWFGARHYEPETGLWMGQDVYRGTLDEPGSLHRFGYVENNPVSYLDLYGYIWSATEFLDKTKKINPVYWESVWLNGGEEDWNETIKVGYKFIDPSLKDGYSLVLNGISGGERAFAAVGASSTLIGTPIGFSLASASIYDFYQASRDFRSIKENFYNASKYENIDDFKYVHYQEDNNFKGYLSSIADDDFFKYNAMAWDYIDFAGAIKNSFRGVSKISDLWGEYKYSSFYRRIKDKDFYKKYNMPRLINFLPKNIWGVFSGYKDIISPLLECKQSNDLEPDKSFHFQPEAIGAW